MRGGGWGLIGDIVLGLNAAPRMITSIATTPIVSVDASTSAASAPSNPFAAFLTAAIWGAG